MCSCEAPKEISHSPAGLITHGQTATVPHSLGEMTAGVTRAGSGREQEKNPRQSAGVSQACEGLTKAQRGWVSSLGQRPFSLRRLGSVTLASSRDLPTNKTPRAHSSILCVHKLDQNADFYNTLTC